MYFERVSCDHCGKVLVMRKLSESEKKEYRRLGIKAVRHSLCGSKKCEAKEAKFYVRPYVE